MRENPGLVSPAGGLVARSLLRPESCSPSPSQSLLPLRDHSLSGSYRSGPRCSSSPFTPRDGSETRFVRLFWGANLD